MGVSKEVFEILKLWKDANYCKCFTDSYILGLYNAAEGIMATLQGRTPIYKSLAPYAEGLIDDINMENILPVEAYL